MKQGQIWNYLCVLSVVSHYVPWVLEESQAEIAYEWDLLGYEDEEVGFYCTLYHAVPRSTTQYPWWGHNTRVFVVHGGASYRIT